MNGASLSERFFQEYVHPLLSNRYSALLPALSAAILGDGSEVLGYDDEISHDHNFCPRVIVFVPDERFGAVGESLRQALVEAAPPSYLGFPLLYDDVRKFIEVVPRQQFFLDYLQIPTFPTTAREWLKLDEQRLVELSGGRIFFDPQGRLAEIRQRLAFYPPAVRYFLLHQGFVRLSEVGAIERAIWRGDFIAMELYRSFFIYFAIKVFHLLQRAHCPYRKWMGKSLERFGEDGLRMKAAVEALAQENDLTQVSRRVHEILALVAEPLLLELGTPQANLVEESQLHLLNFAWGTVLAALRQQIPPDLRDLPALVTPVTFWGIIFDISGLGGTYERALDENLRFLRVG
ncbi:MAG: hypothetical protein DCC55_34835 [Chloroflexi bacterium]|nr:MAG: hypothetical protein DCC55_34835 [Chloroflexota bacterium]